MNATTGQRGVVGITQRSLPPTEFGERRHALDRRWSRFLAACGLVAVPLPNDPAIAVDTARRLDLAGLVLSGGEDLGRYGGPSPDRDETERTLLAWAIAAGRPVLGVCRGAQLIMDVFGTPLARVDGHAGTRHDIVESGRVREVNSYHHYAASAVAAPLTATARAEDVVEAFRHERADVLGIMWHPERETTYDPADLRLVGDLFGSRR